MVDEFIQMVSENSQFQKKMLKGWSLREDERQDLENILAFYMKEQRYSLEDLASAYDFINDMVLEETYYFMKNGSYRYSTFEEVNGIVYQNDEYMQKYMLGLSISDYIWIQHLKMLRWFEKALNDMKIRAGGNYLEIGPGLGQYLIRSLRDNRFSDYLAVDLSPASVDLCRRFLSYCGMDGKKYLIQNVDFFELSTKRQFDCIVMGEVLEHVEQPLEMLEKIYSLLTDTGTAFITTVINAPTVDHIYLFHSEEEVLELADRAGFLVESHICVTANDLSLEKAVKRKSAIDIAMVLKKKDKAMDKR